MIDILLYFVKILFYLVGTFILCGLTVALCEKLFRYFMGHSIGYKAIKVTSILGTPIHELGHAIMCLLFGHRIEEIKLYQINSDDGTLGYVNHSYRKSNLYQSLGNLFIGLGPIFSGLAVIIFLIYLCFPNAYNTFYINSQSILNNDPNVIGFLNEGFKLIFHMYKDNSVSLIYRIIVVIIIFSISLHVQLSVADIKSSIKGFSYFSIIVLIFSLISFLISENLVDSILNSLELFNYYTFSFFIIIIIFSILLVLLSTIFWIVAKIF